MLAARFRHATVVPRQVCRLRREGLPAPPIRPWHWVGRLRVRRLPAATPAFPPDAQIQAE